jgi:hypothetical protein
VLPLKIIPTYDKSKKPAAGPSVALAGVLMLPVAIITLFRIRKLSVPDATPPFPFVLIKDDNPVSLVASLKLRKIKTELSTVNVELAVINPTVDE